MKPLKIYLSKIALLFIAISSLAILYYYAYYKAFDKKCIPQNADAIAMLDKKNIRNSLGFSYLKNPSVWEWGGTESKYKKCFDFSDFGINTPDYFAFFHIENQPIFQWFIALKVDDENIFETELAKANFRKAKLQNGMFSYYSASKALFIIKHSNQILVSNIPEKQKQIAVKVAEDLFLKRLFLDAKITKKTIETTNAITFWIKKNSLLQEDGILNLKLEDQEITVDGQLKLNYRKESQFTENPNALLSLGFNFEMVRKPKLFKQHSDKINKIIGFNLDSILSYYPTKTEFVLNEIAEKKDSAISYEYDDDFNPIKKVIAHNSSEPSFYFSMQTENPKKIYDYLKTQNAIDNHQVFVNFPLAQTKTSVQDNAFRLEANPIKNANSKLTVPKIGYLQIHFNKLQAKDWRYIIAKNKIFSVFKPFEILEIDLSKGNNSVLFQAHLKTKKNNKLISIAK
jgi:hypothetical protein